MTTNTNELFGWTWRAELTRIPGVVEVPAPHGGRWWADVVTPHVPVAFTAPSLAALVALSRIFGKPWRAAVLAAKPLGGSNSDQSWAPPPVSIGWARLALVRGVQQCLPYSVDEVLLAIDESVAWNQAGHPERAVAVLAPVAESLVGLLAAKHAGTLPSATARDVELAAAIALEGLAESNPDRAAIKLADESQPAPPLISGVELDAALADWAREYVRSEPAAALSMADEDADPDRFIVDPAAVGPRVIAWRGPHHREILVTRVAEGVLAEADLADGAETTDQEVSHLRVQASVPGSAELIDQPAHGDETTGQVSAVLPIDPDVDLSEIVVGLTQIDRMARARLDPAGQALARVDRLMIGAWAVARMEQLLPEPDSGRVKDHVRDARIQLNHVPLHLDTTGELEARCDYLGARLRRLEELAADFPGQAPDLDMVTRPLLAESIPVLDGLGW